MKRDELTARIWRTVVFSGAMLGAPLASAQPAQGKPAPVKPADTHASVSKELETNTTALGAAIDAYVEARKQLSAKEEGGAVTTAGMSRKVADLRKARVAIEARLKKLPKPAGVVVTPAAAKLESDLAAQDAKIFAALDAEKSDRTDAHFKATTEKLAALRAERLTIYRKLMAELKRPRSDENERPLGRGFVLA